MSPSVKISWKSDFKLKLQFDYNNPIIIYIVLQTCNEIYFFFDLYESHQKNLSITIHQFDTI